MSTHNICFSGEIRKIISKIWSYVMNNLDISSMVVLQL